MGKKLKNKKKKTYKIENKNDEIIKNNQKKEAIDVIMIDDVEFLKMKRDLMNFIENVFKDPNYNNDYVLTTFKEGYDIYNFKCVHFFIYNECIKEKIKKLSIIDCKKVKNKYKKNLYLFFTITYNKDKIGKYLCFDILSDVLYEFDIPLF